MNARETEQMLEAGFPCAACTRRFVEMQAARHDIRRIARVMGRVRDPGRYAEELRAAKAIVLDKAKVSQQHLSDEHPELTA